MPFVSMLRLPRRPKQQDAGRLPAKSWARLTRCSMSPPITPAEREQFGATLNSFQAVQFMLAESHIARTALREACTATGRTLSGDAAMMTKLLAGRIGRRVGAETLQVLGAIGFTQEHPHHGWFHRVLTIDAVLGRSPALARVLGSRSGFVPERFLSE